MNQRYLLDTHAIVFWQSGPYMPVALRTFLDHEAHRGNVLISAISFWEMALLAKKGRIEIDDVGRWKDEILKLSGARLVNPLVDDMIASANLPDHHSDPFDRLLVCQANTEKCVLVSRDSALDVYAVKRLWNI
jgi:PIN domain nuclease of toxin-antitoxin system